MPTARTSIRQHFWDGVAKPPDIDCWIWTGGKSKDGYGLINLDHTTMHAHRYAYECLVGRIPKAGIVMHTCDVRCCVNPAHLRLGTHARNMADMKAKGRGCRGARVHTARLNEAAVRHIRTSNAPGAELARAFGVTQATISRIRVRKSWAWLDSPAALRE